jgi:hypothetical protein
MKCRRLLTWERNLYDGYDVAAPAPEKNLSCLDPLKQVKDSAHSCRILYVAIEKCEIDPSVFVAFAKREVVASMKEEGIENDRPVLAKRDC